MQMGFQDHDQMRDFSRILAAFVYSTGENLASSTFLSGVGKFMSDYQTFENLGLEKGIARWVKMLIQVLYLVFLNKVEKQWCINRYKLSKNSS